MCLWALKNYVKQSISTDFSNLDLWSNSKGSVKFKKALNNNNRKKYILPEGHIDTDHFSHKHNFMWL